jgi:hypothetical protein
MFVLNTPERFSRKSSTVIVRFEVFTVVIMKKQSSGMWRRVDIVLIDVSEERIASIYRVE